MKLENQRVRILADGAGQEPPLKLNPAYETSHSEATRP
jgi:hypothetical protein